MKQLNDLLAIERGQRVVDFTGAAHAASERYCPGRLILLFFMPKLFSKTAEKPDEIPAETARKRSWFFHGNPLVRKIILVILVLSHVGHAPNVSATCDQRPITEKPREMMHELVARREIMREPVDQKLAYRLRELRVHCNISLTELAGAIGVTRETISRYVHGKSHIPSERLGIMARAMHCEERDLQMPPGSPLPRLRFRPARRQNALPSPYKIDFDIPHYLQVSADELA